MVHGDDKGLVLPPRVAGLQVVIVTIPKSGEEELKDRMLAQARCFEEELKDLGVSVKVCKGIFLLHYRPFVLCCVLCAVC
jgi:prolyl-tRNA synthetase